MVICIRSPGLVLHLKNTASTPGLISCSLPRSFCAKRASAYTPKHAHAVIMGDRRSARSVHACRGQTHVAHTYAHVVVLRARAQGHRVQKAGVSIEGSASAVRYALHDSTARSRKQMCHGEEQEKSL
eukprot:6201712-Pleurochrysis_carterae.AAC.2